MPTPTTAVTPAAPKLTWRAYTDRIAHAFPSGQARALCGERVLPERFERPDPIRRCMACDSLAAERIPEGEARALWGNR